jgi:hypothetical protein
MSSWIVKPQTVITGRYRLIFRRSTSGFPKLEIIERLPGRLGNQMSTIVSFSNDGDVIKIERLKVEDGRGNVSVPSGKDDLTG